MKLFEHRNIFDLADGVIQHDVAPGTILREWLEARYGEAIAFVALVSCDGAAVHRLAWGDVMADGEWRVVLQPGDPITIISTTLSVLSIGNAILNPPPKPNILGEPSPTYSLGAQQNAARIGAGVPVQYGKVRVWPDLAAQPYSVYRDNDQFLFQLFCVGLGEFEFEDLQIDDTDVSAFEEIEFEYYYNQPVTLFPTDVETSAEPASQELTTSDTGPYIANATGTDANRIEVDVVWPSGLFRLSSSGNVRQMLMTLIIEYRAVDDAGAPVGLGTWITMYNGDVIDAERSPKRVTYGVDVTPGRYEVRMRRGQPDDTDAANYSTAQWEAMRAFLETDAPTFTDVTMLAVKARATSNLNNNSARQFNVVCTAKKPVWNGSTWSAATATRSIAWAFADMCRNNYLGGQADSKLDLAQLLALDYVWSSRGDTFNFRFDVPTTRWDALNLIAAAGRAFPVLNADLVSIKRQQAQTVPATIFNRNTIVKGSHSLEYVFQRENSYDSVRAEYYAPEHGWIKNTVLCVPPGSAGLNPQPVTLYGVTDRAQAFREGIYRAESALRQNKVSRLKTELDGYIPSRGDLIKIVNENFDMDQGGELVAVEGSPAVTLLLSEPVTFSTASPAPAHYILLRKDDGTVSGPHLVTPGADSKRVTLNQALAWVPSTGGDRERTKFAFGLLSSTAGDWVVESISPRGGVSVELTCVNYVASVHTVDTGTVPDDITEGPLLVTAGAPVIPYLLVEYTAIPGTVAVAWAPAPGAASYVVERSYDDGVTWAKVAATPNDRVQFLVQPGPLQIRVAGVGAVRGPWKVWDGVTADYTLNSPTDLDLSTQLLFTTSGDYEQRIIFTFEKPAADVWVQFYHVQFKYPGATDWADLAKTKDSRVEFPATTLGTINVRVRSVYVEGERQSDWAETSTVNTGTFTSIAAIGLTDPDDPKMFVTVDTDTGLADIRVSVGYNKATSPQSAEPEALVIFYAVDDVPNLLPITSDAGDKLYIDTSDVVLAVDDGVVTSGSTATAIKYSQIELDVDLSGIYWVMIDSIAEGETRFYKITEIDSSTLYINPESPLPYVPQAGDVVRVIESTFHDSRQPEFMLGFANGEVVKHQGIEFDGANYFIKVASGGRGAEGSTQANLAGQDFHYFPAYGNDTRVIILPISQFDFDGSTLTYSGSQQLGIPDKFNWAAASCCFIREATKQANTAFVRSNILPLTNAGRA